MKSKIRMYIAALNLFAAVVCFATGSIGPGVMFVIATGLWVIASITTPTEKEDKS